MSPLQPLRALARPAGSCTVYLLRPVTRRPDARRPVSSAAGAAALKQLAATQARASAKTPRPKPTRPGAPDAAAPEQSDATPSLGNAADEKQEAAHVYRAPHAPSHPPEYVERRNTFVPQPLARPLGQADPPQPGDNDGADRRPWRQRRDEFLDYDQHLARRRDLTRRMQKPYYYDWNRIGKGKAFLAPAQLLRADRALYVPNFHGATLAQPGVRADSTAVLPGRVSLFTFHSAGWAEGNVRTFVDQNPALLQVLAAAGAEGGAVVQRVRIDYEDAPLRRALQRLFLGRLRRQVPAAEHARYFLVSQGVTEELKEALGMFNVLNGAVYLVDGLGRIRWAGMSNAQEDERESLVRGLVRLVAEVQRMQAEGKAVGPPWPAKETVARTYKAMITAWEEARKEQGDPEVAAAKAEGANETKKAEKPEQAECQP